MLKVGGAIPESVKRSLIRNLPWVFLVCILVVTASMRYRFIDIPLERDEGEYAYAGQLILQGVPPYKQLYNMKLPGIYAVYAGIMTLFGQTHRGIHLGLLLINAVTIALVYLIAKKVLDSLAGLSASASFAVLTIGQSVQGFFANAEHFVIVFAVAGLLVLLHALDNEKWYMLFFSGLLMGIGLLIKQHGAVFVVFGGIFVLTDRLRNSSMTWQRLIQTVGIFIIGAILPYGLTCLVLSWAGVFESFWFWTVSYALAYSTQMSVYEGWAILKVMVVRVIGSAPLIWALAGIGLTAIVWDFRMRKWALFIVMFAVFSFLAICPGFYFRSHYFLLLLPATAILSGIAVSSLSNILESVQARTVRYGLPILIISSSIFLTIYQHRHFLFQMTPVQACRTIYGLNPFPESIEISKYIKAHTNENDRITVLGSEPQIYFYSIRRSSSGYIYMYPLMENHDFAEKMQKEMIQEIESVKPKYFIYVQVDSSWLERPNSCRLIFDWSQDYLQKHYQLVGLVDLLNDGTQYSWGAGLKWPPRSRLWVAVLERM